MKKIALLLFLILCASVLLAGAQAPIQRDTVDGPYLFQYVGQLNVDLRNEREYSRKLQEENAKLKLRIKELESQLAPKPEVKK